MHILLALLQIYLKSKVNQSQTSCEIVNQCFDDLPSSKKSVPMYNYRKGNYESMNDYFGSINWSEVLSGNVHDDWHVFKVTVQDAIAKYIPTFIPKNNKPTPPWWSKNLSKAIKAKQLSFTKYKHSKSRSDYATYANVRYDPLEILMSGPC